MRCASKQLPALDLETIKEDLGTKGIRWEFNPPGASHFGGFYERKIGSVRRILEASLVMTRNHNLSRDEFHTLLQECAAIVNNTPLWAVSESPDDPAPLSPATLITLKESPVDINVESFTERDLLAYGTKRWRRVQSVAEEFWSRWNAHYLQELQQRKKWTTTRRSLMIGDIVLVREKNAPRNSWPLGRVEEVKPSADGLVRSVFVRLGKGCKKLVYRAVANLVLLVPTQDNSTNETDAVTASQGGECHANSDE